MQGDSRGLTGRTPVGFADSFATEGHPHIGVGLLGLDFVASQLNFSTSVQASPPPFAG